MSEYKIIKNRPGKIYSVSMILLFFIFELFLYPGILKIWFPVICLNFVFIFFFFKEVHYDKEILEIFYPLRPFWRRRRVNMRNIKLVSFMAYGGGGSNSYPYILFRFSKFPFITQIRIQKPEEVLDFFRTVAENNTFSVKSRMKQNHYVINDLMKLGIKSNLNFKGE